MNLYDFGGTHIFCDVTAANADIVGDTDLISGAIVRGIRVSGATLCGMQVKEFEPSGMTAVYLLSESHVSVHTYPDSSSLFLDAFTCGQRCSPQVIVDEVLAVLGTCEHRTTTVRRGQAVQTVVTTPRWRETGASVVRLAPEPAVADLPADLQPADNELAVPANA